MRAKIGFLFLAFLVTASGAPREWTAADGRKMKAEFVSAADGKVTIKREADGQTMTVALTLFSKEDQDWVKEQMAKPAPKAEPKAVEGAYADKLTGDWVLAEFDGLPYAIFGAKTLDGAKKYPLLLALHGKDDNNTNGNQIRGWMKIFASAENYEKNPCVILAPLCYQPHGATGGGWNREPGEKAVDLVKDVIKNMPIVDEDRIYVSGYSMGGFGATHLVNEESRLFAAAIAVAGATTGATDGFKRTPIWLFHAVDDTVVGVEGTRNFYEAIKRNKSAKYTEWETGGHGIGGKVFNDPEVHAWLFAQKK